VIQEADKLIEQQLIERYVQGAWKEHKDVVTALATFDGFEPSAYPGFDAFYKSLSTRLETNHVRKMVRAHARRLVQDDRAKEFAHDLQEDAQLQRGVFEVLRKLGDDPAGFKEYAYFATKFGNGGSAKAQPPAEGEEHGTAVR